MKWKNYIAKYTYNYDLHALEEENVMLTHDYAWYDYLVVEFLLLLVPLSLFVSAFLALCIIQTQFYAWLLLGSIVVWFLLNQLRLFVIDCREETLFKKQLEEIEHNNEVQQRLFKEIDHTIIQQLYDNIMQQDSYALHELVDYLKQEKEFNYITRE